MEPTFVAFTLDNDSIREVLILWWCVLTVANLPSSLHTDTHFLRLWAEEGKEEEELMRSTRAWLQFDFLPAANWWSFCVFFAFFSFFFFKFLYARMQLLMRKAQDNKGAEHGQNACIMQKKKGKRHAMLNNDMLRNSPQTVPPPHSLFFFLLPTLHHSFGTPVQAGGQPISRAIYILFVALTFPSKCSWSLTYFFYNLFFSLSSTGQESARSTSKGGTSCYAFATRA